MLGYFDADHEGETNRLIDSKKKDMFGRERSELSDLLKL